MRLCFVAVAITTVIASSCDRKETVSNASAGMAPSSVSEGASDTPPPRGGSGMGVRQVPAKKAAESYTWIGGADFLVFRDNQCVNAVRKNADSGEELPLPGLAKRLRESLAKPDDVNLITGVSADGKWLLWWPLGGKHFYAASLDGAGLCSWERPAAFLSPCWLADGHHWVVTQETNVLFGGAQGASTNLLLFDPDVPTTVKTIKVIAKFEDDKTAAATRKYSDFNSVGSTNNGPVQARGFQYVIAGPVAVRRDLSVEVPEALSKNAAVGVPRVAPDGERLVWRAEPKDGTTVTFHISRLDGSGMQKVADYTGPAKDKPKFGLFDPHWSPDGKRLSFLADGFLYTFPAAGR